jgi:hypothetical protein
MHLEPASMKSYELLIYWAIQAYMSLGILFIAVALIKLRLGERKKATQGTEIRISGADLASLLTMESYRRNRTK